MTGPGGQTVYPNQTMSFGFEGAAEGQTSAWLLYWNNLFDPQPLMRGSNGQPANDTSGLDTFFSIPPTLDDSGCYNAAEGYQSGRQVTGCTVKVLKGPYYGTAAGQPLPWPIFTASLDAGPDGLDSPIVLNCGGTCAPQWSDPTLFYELPVFLEPSPYAGFDVLQSGSSEDFTDTTKSDILISSWSWNFGDGETSTAENPVHTYAKAGSYTVSLTVVTADGQTDTSTQTVIESHSNPTVSGTVTDLSGNGVQTTMTLVNGTTGAFQPLPTNADGHYAATLPKGSYEIRPSNTDPAGTYTPFAAAFQLEQDTTENFTFNGYRIDASVANAAGAPVPKITVDVTGSGTIVSTPSDSDPNGFVTDSTGNADVEATPGTYTVTPVNPHPAQNISFAPPSAPAAVSAADVDLSFELVDETPIVTSVTPNAGPVAGGTTVAISGGNFFQSGVSAVTGVNFLTKSGKSFPATSYNVLSDTSISAVSPDALKALPPDDTTVTADVVVTTAEASSLRNTGDQFVFGDVPVVTNLFPDEGPYLGGSTVTVDGQNFTGATKVVLKLASGSVTPKTFDPVSPTVITFTAPALPAGVKPQIADVVVTTPDGSSPTGEDDQFDYRPLNVVQIGDSIASGEGINYDFTYNSGTGLWNEGNTDPTWSGTYQGCHQSDQAYGNLVASAITANSFTTFACTGATYDVGVEGPETANGENIPPQFGPWPDGPPSQINQLYDAAEPDVVLVSLGADDIEFSDIVEHCIANAFGNRAVGDAVPLNCIPSNPGPTVKKDFFANLPDVTAHLTQLANDIAARGKASDTGIVPKVIFSDYYNPFPTTTTCLDTAGLYPEQLSYLSAAVLKLDATIKDAVDAVAATDTNVGFAEMKDVLAGHQWCSSDPEAYGLSIEYATIARSWRAASWTVNPAPFHPTPAGQQALATIATAAVKALLAATG